MSSSRQAGTRKPRPNITPEDVGTLYQEGERVYRLISCETEPSAIMEGIADEHGSHIQKLLSKFKDFVRLKPERKIPKPRKPRKDKGTHRQGTTTISPEVQVDLTDIEQVPTSSGQVSPGGKTKEGLTREEVEDLHRDIIKPTNPKPEPKKRGRKTKPHKLGTVISNFKVKSGQAGELHKMTLGKETVETQMLLPGALELMSRFGITKADVEAAPDSEGKQLLLSIL